MQDNPTNFESPFLNAEILSAESEQDLPPHSADLIDESPFGRLVISTEFVVDEDEWIDEGELLADEEEIQFEKAGENSEDSIDETFDEEEASYEEEVIGVFDDEASDLYRTEWNTQQPSETTEEEVEAFLDEYDEEDEYGFIEDETLRPPPQKVEKRALPIPNSIPVPFAPTPPQGSYWPIVTNIRAGREVNYLDVDNRHVGNREGRRFLASRNGGARYHVGVDLFANFNDPIVACQDGTIVNFYGFCCNKKKTSYALLVEHANVVINYGEVTPDSLQRAGLKVNSTVKAGQVIGFVGKNPGGSSMLHFETYVAGAVKNAQWEVGKSRPINLLNPTEYLLYLREFGLVGQAAVPSSSKPSLLATAKPAVELVRFAQMVLNATESENLVVDGFLGPKTRRALEVFRGRYRLGDGGDLNASVETALVQRALEHLAQQSLFARHGTSDQKTKEVLTEFKIKHGLGSTTIIDAMTRAALGDAITLTVQKVGVGVTNTQSVSMPFEQNMPDRLGMLTFRRDEQTAFQYQFTADDLLWTARLVSGEAGAKDDLENRAVITAMLNRFALFTHRVYRTFSGFLRAYSTPLQSVLLNKKVAQHYMSDPRFRRTGGTYDGTEIPRGQLQHHLELQNTSWSQLRPIARRIALEALTGQMPDTGIGIASEFASTWILYGRRVGRKNRTEAGWLDYTSKFKSNKGWRWIGNRPNLDQKRNAFFVDPRAANLSSNSVRVIAAA